MRKESSTGKPGQTTLERIISAGKEEFFRHSFKEASLRSIVRSAGVTTGAFYGYFPDKEALFSAIVEPAVKRLHKTFMKAQEDFAGMPVKLKAETAFSYSRKELTGFIDSIYDDFDIFKLVLCRSAGTKYENFINSLVEIEVEYTCKFLRALKREGFTAVELEPNLMRILFSAYFHALFETVEHDMSREEAEDYIGSLSEFFSAGWKKLWRI